MLNATVSKLKATLSGYLTRVKAGEEVVVTERGKPIAKLVPLPRDASSISPHLIELAKGGSCEDWVRQIAGEVLENAKTQGCRGGLV